jgi:phage shock protein PspC (stress-responsive transcriptional regulator)
MTNFIRLLFLFFTFLGIHQGDVFGILLSVVGFLIMENLSEELEKINH